MIKFARDVLEFPLDPWQQWAVIHAGELLEDGRPRFRKVLLLVARQNGKTTLPVVLALFWQFVVKVPLILGTSTKLDYAKEAWQKSVELGNASAALAPFHDRKWTRNTNGEQESWTFDRSRYKIATSDEEGGRSLTIHKLICDELRQHHDYSAWDAAVPAGNAVRDFQVWALSNAGDARSVVLNDLRDAALKFIRTGEGDAKLGLFEWSAPPGSSPVDLEALAQANPNLGRRGIDPADLVAEGQAALDSGGAKLAGFLTECMCISVPQGEPAIDAAKWARALELGDLGAARGRVAVCLELAPDGLQAATLTAAATMPDGRVRVEPQAAWQGPGFTEALRRDLRGLLERLRPRVLGWMPGGPTAALAADLRSGAITPPGLALEEIRADVPAVCMGLAELVDAGGVVHSGDPRLDTQLGESERQYSGNVWVIRRRAKRRAEPGAVPEPLPVDAVYSAAGAIHLARTLPASLGEPRVLFVFDDEEAYYGDAA